jgi:hypothetical protein
MKLSLDLIESNAQIQNDILNALLPDITNYMNKGIAKIRAELPTIVENSIRSSPEYLSLLSGKLRLEFGIPDAISKVLGLINIWINNIQYTYQAPRIQSQSIRSKIKIELIRADYGDVLGSDFAEVLDQSGYSLPWLKWLLLDGNYLIVPNHQVVIGPSRSSRTGFAVMRKSNAGWKVPSEFAGTEDDNWITRALDSAEPEIENLLDRALS